MEVSSLLSLEVDGLARPTNIRAMVAGDTLASGVIPSGINRAASGVNVSSTLWNTVYNQVQASAGYWNVAAGVADLSYVSGVIDSVSATAANSSSILNASSGIWNETYETVLANSATWGGISDASSLRGSPLSATLVPSAGQSLVYDGSVWTASTVVATGGGGVTDHGALTGLADDDHPQYVLSATNNNLSSLVNNHIASAVHWDLATLNSNYINASGDSANAAFFFQTLSATTVSATNYLNIRPNVSSVNSAATTSFTAGGDYDTYLIDTTTTSVIAYLPEASSYTNKMITFSKVDDGGSYRSVTVSGAQLITATNTVILYDPTESVTVISNGTNWYSLDYDRSYGVVFVCKNSTGATLTKGTPVRVSGATGANVLITPASAVNTAVPESPSGFLARVIGVVEHDIPDGEFGHVLTKGSLYKYNTNGFNEGDALYLAANGGLTNIKPTPPYEEIFIGIVTRKQAVNGSLLIDIQNPEHINSIVGFNLASSISERDVIAYDLTTSTFKNYNPSSFNVSSATSATLALSATSALNAERAPNGFTVTGTLTATTASATTYLNLPSSIATWNASALQGKTLNAAAPTINEILRYNGTQWINDSETQYSLNGELGAGWTINAASGINFTNTATNTFRITANYTSGIWNASALQGSPLSATLVPTTNQGLIYNGSVWTASTLPAIISDHGALTGLADNDHPQYVLSATNNALSSLVNNHITSSTVHFTQAEIDHGAVLGLNDNDHPQYVLSSTNSSLSSLVDNHITSSTVHFTQAEIDHGAILGLADNDHPQYVLSSTNNALSSLVNNHVTSSTVHFTQAEIDHGTIGGLSDNDHPQYVLSSTNNALSSTVSNHITSSTVHFTQAEIDHGSILGLSDNDHPQYVLSSTNSALSSLVNDHITSSTVHFTEASINHANIQNIGVNTHVQIDSHLSATNNPHSVTATQVGNTTAQWNASALQGKALSITFPAPSEILRYNGTSWINDTETQYTLNGEFGSGWTINAASGINFTNTSTNTFRISANYTSGIWNANKLLGYEINPIIPNDGEFLVFDSFNNYWTPSSVSLGGGGGGGGISDASSLRGSPLSATLVPVAGQALMYDGSVWTASAALFAYTYGSGAPTGGSDGDIYLQTDVEALQVATVSATTVSAINLIAASGEVSSTRLTDYSERKSSPTISSSSLTLDLNAAQVFTVSLNSNISTLTISNTESRANSVQGFTLILTADGTARTITWPGSVKWPSGTGPTLTSTNNKVDILSFVSPDNGTTWYGFIGGQNY